MRRSKDDMARCRAGVATTPPRLRANQKRAQAAANTSTSLPAAALVTPFDQDPHPSTPFDPFDDSIMNAEALNSTPLPFDFLEIVDDDMDPGSPPPEPDFPNTAEPPADWNSHDVSQSEPHGNSALIFPRWQAFWSLLATQGSLKTTKSQFQLIRLLIRGLREEYAVDCTSAYLGLPHWDTVTRRYKEEILQCATVLFHWHTVPLNLSLSGAQCTKRRLDGTPVTSVAIIPPS